MNQSNERNPFELQYKLLEQKYDSFNVHKKIKQAVSIQKTCIPTKGGINRGISSCKLNIE